jgi:SAM-dependent methyltransferase
MSLMDMEDYESAIGEASRVLKPGGRFVSAITHPCFESRNLDGAEVCGWETRILPDGTKENLFLRTRDYFKRHSDTVEWKKSERRPYGFTTTHFHRTLSDYVNTLSRHGLLVRRIKEPMPTERVLWFTPLWRNIGASPSL